MTLSTSSYRVLAQGNFSRAEVTQTLNLEGHRIEEEPAENSARWEDALERARRSGKNLFNAPLVRLAGLRQDTGGLQLQYGHTSYRDYFLSRASCARSPWSGNPDPIGSAVIVMTADQMVPLGRRSQYADVNPGRFFSFGGFFDPTDLGPTGSLDIFSCAEREWKEEVGLELPPHALRLISVVYDLVHPHPEIAFTAKVNYTSDEVRNSAWGAELDDLILVPLAELREFISLNATEFTHSLLGALEVFTSFSAPDY